MNIDTQLKIWSQCQVALQFCRNRHRTNGDVRWDIVWVDYPSLIEQTKDEVNINCCNSDQQ